MTAGCYQLSRTIVEKEPLIEFVTVFRHVCVEQLTTSIIVITVKQRERERWVKLCQSQ